jgi:hypothetical protein
VDLGLAAEERAELQQQLAATRERAAAAEALAAAAAHEKADLLDSYRSLSGVLLMRGREMRKK